MCTDNHISRCKGKSSVMWRVSAEFCSPIGRSCTRGLGHRVVVVLVKVSELKKATADSQKGHVNRCIFHNRTDPEQLCSHTLPLNSSSWCNTSVLRDFHCRRMKYSPPSTHHSFPVCGTNLANQIRTGLVLVTLASLWVYSLINLTS